MNPLGIVEFARLKGPDWAFLQVKVCPLGSLARPLDKPLLQIEQAAFDLGPQLGGYGKLDAVAGEEGELTVLQLGAGFLPLLGAARGWARQVGRSSDWA